LEGRGARVANHNTTRSAERDRPVCVGLLPKEGFATAASQIVSEMRSFDSTVDSKLNFLPHVRQTRLWNAEPLQDGILESRSQARLQKETIGSLLRRPTFSKIVEPYLAAVVENVSIRRIGPS